jgi:hypothetical protein
MDTTTESEAPEQLAGQEVTVTDQDVMVMDPERDREGPPEPEERQTAALAHLGAEGLSRLRARYAEVLARITDRPLDETAREELKVRAERLNPDAWVTDEEVRQGLEQYEAVFENLRSVVGHPRRRRRRRG